MINIEENKQEFITLVKQSIKRQGVEKLLSWLEKQDFFTAPASSRFHLNCEGGLCQHSLNVYYRLKNECRNENEYISQEQFNSFDEPKDKVSMSDETIAIVSLFHDLCKVNYYKQDTRNVKNKNTGQWEQVPYYTIDEKVSLGHGEKSVIILQQFMRLSMEEIIAINSHMGFSDKRVVGGDYSIINMWDKYPLALLLHVADLKASKIDEVDK